MPNPLQETIDSISDVKDSLTGKEGDGLVCSFGEFQHTPLTWKSFRMLIAMRCKSQPASVPAHIDDLEEVTA